MSDIIQAISQFSDQCKQAWEESSKIKLPEWNVKNIVVCGMGGSALGAHVFQNITPLRVPFTIINDYHLPTWVSEDTLVILISYSGNTEEVITCAIEAKNFGCKTLGITSGGKLGIWLKDNDVPAYIFEPKHNPTGQPRMGIGYGLFALLGLLNAPQFNHKRVIPEELSSILDKVRYNTELIRAQAEDFAQIMKGKMPIIFASGYMGANAHIFSNQLNETAKTYASWVTVPEANHHLLEGLKHPDLNAICIFLGNPNYSDKIKKRLEITAEILHDNGWEVLLYSPGTQDSMQLVLETILFSSFVSTYLGLIYEEDPLAIPNVDYFKEQLG